MKKTFLILQYRTLKSAVPELGDGRAIGSSAIGDEGQDEISLRPDGGGTRVCILQSSKLEGSYIGTYCTYSV